MDRKFLNTSSPQRHGGHREISSFSLAGGTAKEKPICRFFNK
jgi:hypothetical protein